MLLRPYLSVALLGLFLVVLSGCGQAPAIVAPDEIRGLEQNWSADDQQQFYHTPQGGEIMPYAWFMALEQPSFDPLEEPLGFASPNYLARFGFLPSVASALNPDGLPIGLVKDSAFVDPATQETRAVVSLTCAACHTGQLRIRAPDLRLVSLRIDGGAGLIDLEAFEQSLGQAIFLTEYNPLQFARFARKVLGDGYNSDSKRELRQQLTRFYRAGAKKVKINSRLHLYPSPSGYGRLDGFNRLANDVFGMGLATGNLRVANAPVDYPPIWEVSWFDFAHYTGALPNPLLRNIAETLRTNAQVVLTGSAEARFNSSANVRNLVLLENIVAGEAPYRGLVSPRWPTADLGAIDPVKAAAGARLYAQHCAHCHLPPKELLQADLAAEHPVYWTAATSLGQPLLQLFGSELSEVGTDPQHARDLVERKVDTGELGWGEMTAATAMDTLTRAITKRYFAANKIDEEHQLDWELGHSIATDRARFQLVYKARPLSGIWATPPYLHNGSVPNLYHLLSPVSERPKVFTLGTTLYDPGKVGYGVGALPEQGESPAPGVYVLDTALPGNSNAGHEFNNGYELGVKDPAAKVSGIIGPLLSESERWELVEFLKTL